VKHKKIILIASVIVVLAAVLSLVWFNSRKDEVSGTKQPQIISGKLNGISNECQSDGACGVTLDSGKTIITGCGLMAGGKTCKAYDQTKLKYGERIEATVIQTDTSTYTLECETCTIRTNN
jgi:hypothetical protein